MSGSGTNTETGAPERRRRPRWVFQVDSSADRTVLRVLDTESDRVFREIPIEEFLAYARTHKNVTPWLLGQLPKGARPVEG